MNSNTFNETTLASILSVLLPAVVQQISTSQPNLGAQSVVPPSSNLISPTSVSVPPAQSAAQLAITQTFANVRCAASQGQFVPKPSGQAGRKVNGYNLQDMMGFKGHFPHYKLVRTIVERACGCLNMALPYSKQDAGHIKVALSRARSRLPLWFSNYQDDWPLRAIIIGHLKTNADKVKRLNQLAQAHVDNGMELTDPPTSDDAMAPQLLAAEAEEAEVQPDDEGSAIDDSEPPSWLDPSLYTTPSRPPNEPTAPTAAVEEPTLPAPAFTAGNLEHVEPASGALPARNEVAAVAQPVASPTATGSADHGGSEAAISHPEQRKVRPPPRKPSAKSLGKSNLQFNARGLMAAVNKALQAPESASSVPELAADPEPISDDAPRETASKRTRRSTTNKPITTGPTRATINKPINPGPTKVAKAPAPGKQGARRNMRAKATAA